LSATWVYGTGNVFTIPISTYEVYSHIPGLNQTGVNQYYNSAREIPDYRERNNFRAPPYHRLDVGVQFHKKMKKDIPVLGSLGCIIFIIARMPISILSKAPIILQLTRRLNLWRSMLCLVLYLLLHIVSNFNLTDHEILSILAKNSCGNSGSVIT
jgi:hypothetical protein